MFIYDGKKLPVGVEFVIGSSKYGADWLNKATPEDLKEVGITVVDDPIRPDDQYYWVTENEDGTFSSKSKDLNMLKKMVSDRINSQAFSILSPTDYVEVLNLRDSSYKPEWIVWRDKVRLQAREAKLNINKCVDIDSLIDAGKVAWEKDPIQAA